MAEFLDARRQTLLMERITRGGGGDAQPAFKPASATQRGASASPTPPDLLHHHHPIPSSSNGPPAPPAVLLFHQPGLPLNDGSNLSSAGSVSDCGGPETPEKAPNSVTAVVDSVIQSSLAHSIRSSEKKRRTKRPRAQVASEPGAEPESHSNAPKTPRSEKKMDDFIVRKKPMAKSIGFAAVPTQNSQNNFSSSFPSEFVPISPGGGGSNSRDAGEVLEAATGHAGHRTTPTALCPYPTSDGSASNSNQSPPNCSASVGVPGTNGLRLYGHSQTEASLEDVCRWEAASEEVKELQGQMDELAAENKELAGEADVLRRSLEDTQDQLAARLKDKEDQDVALAKSRDMMCKLLTEQSVMDRKQRRTRCMEDRLRLGQYTTERTMHQFQEKWQEGYAFEEVAKKQLRIREEKEEIEQATKLLRKSRKPSATAAVRERQRQASQREVGVGLAEPASPGPSTSEDGAFLRPDNPREITQQDYHERDEIYRLRREQLKKEEAECLSEQARLERERQLHIREIKRIQNEDASKHKDHAVLHKRFLLLSLLGKGGFSEVWKSFDLEENRYVACKIHHVNKDWKEEKKANYVKHALREKDIHKSLIHPRIVSLHEVFTIDNHSFCTVLEYCDGNDLDFYLKQNKLIPEKEARSIIMQVINALKYLNDIKPPVIHYDLKPANILLSSGTASGEVKITDFGLSKLAENDGPDAEIELTSQGAGTYWYLPPECFVMGHQPPKISSKVDVWSVGVIFYQCLYGRRPFGHEQTQEGIMKEQTILKATNLDFPNKPPVSAEAKAFIRCCLQYRKEERADVHQLYTNEYMRPRSLRTSSSGRTSASDPRAENPSGAVSPSPSVSSAAPSTPS